MPKDTSTNDDPLLTTKEAAAYLGAVPRRTLEGWRLRDQGGPEYVKLGKRAVRYRRSALDRWLDQRSAAPMPTIIDITAVDDDESAERGSQMLDRLERAHLDLIARVRDLELCNDLRLLLSLETLRGWAQTVNRRAIEAKVGQVSAADLETLAAEIHRAADAVADERAHILEKVWSEVSDE